MAQDYLWHAAVPPARSSGRATRPAKRSVDPARQTRRDIEIARAAVEDIVGVDAGRLDVAGPPTLAVAPLASSVGDFRAAHPGIVIVLADPTDTAELVELVRSGRSEIGLAEEVHVEGLTTVPIGEQDFLVVLPPGSHGGGPLPLEELADLPLVARLPPEVPPGDSSTRRWGRWGDPRWSSSRWHSARHSSP